MSLNVCAEFKEIDSVLREIELDFHSEDDRPHLFRLLTLPLGPLCLPPKPRSQPKDAPLISVENRHSEMCLCSEVVIIRG